MFIFDRLASCASLQKMTTFTPADAAQLLPGAMPDRFRGRLPGSFFEGPAGWLCAWHVVNAGTFRFSVFAAALGQPVVLFCKPETPSLQIIWVLQGSLPGDGDEPALHAGDCCLWWMPGRSAPVAFGKGLHFSLHVVFPSFYQEELKALPVVQALLDSAVQADKTAAAGSVFRYGHRSLVLLRGLEILLDEAGGRMSVDSVLMELCRCFIKDFGEANRRAMWMRARLRTMEELEAYVLNHVMGTGSRLTLETAAAAMGMAPALARKLLKERFHTSWHGYLTRVRMEQAAEWLRETDKTVAGIAYTLDYRDPGSFSRAFSSHFGVSPSAYRKKTRP